jgi:hypothetical protein
MTVGAFGEAPSVEQPFSKPGTVTTLTPELSANVSFEPSGENEGWEYLPSGPS